MARPNIQRSKVSCCSSQLKLTSFTRRLTWKLQNLDHCHAMNVFQFGVQRKASRQATTSVICDMSSGDIQNGDKSEFHQVKLIDGFSFMSMGNMFIKDDDGKELEVKYMPGCSLHDKYVNFGDIGTSSMYFQLLDVPACVLAITSKGKNCRQAQGSLET